MACIYSVIYNDILVAECPASEPWRVIVYPEDPEEPVDEESRIKEACKEFCVDNNVSGINCFTDCDACGEGLDECPTECVMECDDCLCCVCREAPVED